MMFSPETFDLGLVVLTRLWARSCESAPTFTNLYSIRQGGEFSDRTTGSLCISGGHDLDATAAVLHCKFGTLHRREQTKLYFSFEGIRLSSHHRWPGADRRGMADDRNGEACFPVCATGGAPVAF